MPRDPSTLASFIPAVAVRHCLEHPEPLETATTNRFDAGVLFLDISGFTPLAESLTRLGSEGSEKLTKLLNAYFGELIHIVSSHGGEVVSFAGDAFIAVWLKGRAGDTAPEVVNRLASCAMSMQRAQPELKRKLDVSLAFKLGIGLGRFELLHLGGRGAQWALLCRGSAVERAIGSEGYATPGDIIVAPEAWAHLKGDAKGSSVGSEGHRRVQKLMAESEPGEIEEVLVPPELETRLTPYVLPAVQSRLDVGHAAWLGELRRLSVMFLNLPDLKANTKLLRVHKIVEIVQSAIFQYEGTINKLSVDEKGVSVLAVFGLPPLAHEQDAERAIRAGLKIASKLQAKKLECSIGVTTGKAFCGVVGSNLRREYTVIGDVVNLSARLMQAAKKSILCDAATKGECSDAVQFETLEPIRVKGKTEPIEAFRPKKAKKKVRATHAEPQSAVQMVGRVREKKIFEEAIEALTQKGTSRVITVRGEPGVGKSVFLDFARAHVRKRELLWAVSEGSAMETSTPYLLWQKILWRLLGPKSSSREEFRERLKTSLYPAGIDKQSLALLNDVVNLGFRETKLTESISGSLRVERVCQFVTKLIKHRCDDHGLVLFIDDAQWLDLPSWKLLAAIVRGVERLVVVLGLRSAPVHQVDSVDAVLGNARDIDLGPLSEGETHALIRECSGTDNVQSIICDTVFAKSGGNPFFAVEMMRSLIDAGHTEVVDSDCLLADGRSDLSNIEFPTNIEGLITARIDRLPAREQFALKVASVVGSIFNVELIRAVFPLEEDRRQVKSLMDKLVSRGLTVKVSVRPPAVYKFVQTSVQEAAYGLMLFEHRRKIHADIARWYEDNKKEQLANFLPLIAFHWGASGDVGKALKYLEEAAIDASDAAVHTDVTRFVEQALECAEGAKEAGAEEIDRHRYVRLHRLLADAYYGLGQVDESAREARKALEYFGFSLPSSSAGWTTRGPLYWLQQNAQRLLTGFGSSKKQKAAFAQASLAASRLATCSMVQHDEAPMVGAAQLAVHLGKRAGKHPSIAAVYTSAGTMMSVNNAHKKAERYFDKARQIAKTHKDHGSLLALSNAVASYAMGTAQWQSADTEIRKAREKIKTHGDREDRDRIIYARADLYYFQGQIHQSQEEFTRLLKFARRHKSAGFQAMAHCGLARNHLVLGSYKHAQKGLEASRKLLRGKSDYSLELLCRGLSSLVLLRQGNTRGAIEQVNGATELMARGVLASYMAVAGYVAMAEAFVALSLLANHGKLGEDADYDEQAEQALRALSEVASQWVIGLPSSTRLQAHYRLLHDEHKKARKALEESLECARRIMLPLDEAMALLDLGRCRGVPPSQQIQYLKGAHRILTRLNCHNRALIAEKAIETLKG